MEIKLFDISKFSKLCLINLIMNGFDYKYNVIKFLLKLKQNHPTNLAVEFNEKISNVFSELIDNRLIYPNYSPIILQNIFDRNKKMLENKLNSKLLFITYHTLNYKLYQDTNIQDLVQNYKKHNISWLDIEQSVSPKPKEIYKSYDWIIFGPEVSLSKRIIIYNRYFRDIDDNIFDKEGNFIKTFEEFDKIFFDLTTNYNLMVFDNKNNSNNITDKIFKLDLDNILNQIKS